MLPAFLCPEQSVDENGAGEVLQLSRDSGEVLLLTLGITDVVEQESLDVLIRGSADGAEWDSQTFRVFPQKFYRGTSAILLDLSLHAEIRFLRAEWIVHRWGVGSKTPLFKFYVYAEKFDHSATT